MTAVVCCIAGLLVLGWLGAAGAVGLGWWLLDERERVTAVALIRTRHLHEGGMAGRWDPNPPDHRERAVIALATAVIRAGIPVPQRAAFIALHPNTWTQEPTS